MEQKDDEILEVSEQYKKGFNKADWVLTYMPHVLKGVKMPEKDETEYDKGFTARLLKYEKDQQMLKEYAPEKPNFLKDRGDVGKTQDKKQGPDKTQ